MKHKSGKTSSLKYCTNNFPANILSFDVDYFIELVSQILDIVILLHFVIIYILISFNIYDVYFQHFKGIARKLYDVIYI